MPALCPAGAGSGRGAACGIRLCGRMSSPITAGRRSEMRSGTPSQGERLAAPGLETERAAEAQQGGRGVQPLLWACEEPSPVINDADPGIWLLR